jgi:transposase
MSSIVPVKVGRHTYLYESYSYRDAKGKPQNKRRTIGKLDPVTGLPLYKPEYVERMAQEGTPVDTSLLQEVFSAEEISRSSIRERGVFYLLNEIASGCGLLDALEESNPRHWQKLFVLACYLVASGDPFLYCENWVKATECLPVGSLSSQRISELLSRVTHGERQGFYQAWSRLRREQEYLALDITSLSSYSRLIEEVQWGYNRDGEELPQINLCLLLGETSRLPVYQHVYSGSLKDVTTLEHTLATFDGLTDGKPALLVMDKGFYSQRNINWILDKKHYQFLIAVPFTAGIAQKNVASEAKDIDQINHTIVLGKDSLRGVTKNRVWNANHNLYVHVYYHALKAKGIQESLFAYVTTLKDEAKANPEKALDHSESRKYLHIRRSEKQQDGYTITVRQEVIDNQLKHAGWMVLISNHVSDAKEALEIYRDKDVVEKGFLRYKNSLDLGRLRVHQSESMHNKNFVGFLSLILLSVIHQKMVKQDLYKKMTLKQLLLTLSAIRVQEINGVKIQSPLTRQQQDIYKALGVKVPV